MRALRWQRSPPFAGVGEIAVAGSRDKARADCGSRSVRSAGAACIGGEHRIEGGDDAGVIEVFGVELESRVRRTRRRDRGCNGRAFADEADFRDTAAQPFGQPVIR